MGAHAMTNFVVALFFLRFWRGTRDRLFAIFALAFCLLGLTRIVLVIVTKGQAGTPAAIEEHTYVYWVRFAAFALILLAIIDKNRPRKSLETLPAKDQSVGAS